MNQIFIFKELVQNAKKVWSVDLLAYFNSNPELGANFVLLLLLQYNAIVL